MIRALFLEELSLWNWAWQSTLFALIGLAVSILLRHRPARACQGLFFAMVAAVWVPLMSVLVGHFGLGLFAPEPVVHEPGIPSKAIAVDYETFATLLPADIQIHKEPSEIQVDVVPRDFQANGVPIEPVPVKATVKSVRLPWRSIFLYGWIVASLVLLGRLCVAFVGGVRLLRRTKLRHCERIHRAVSFARKRIGITRNLLIRSGRNVSSPMIWCWSKSPILLIPDDLNGNVDWGDVICHELAHWRRRDHLTGLMAELIVCIIPWNPFLWWARKRVLRLGEQACDDWVLAGGRAGTDYAQSLLNLSPKEQMAFLPTMIGKEKPMKERIYRIVKEKYGDPRIGARWALAMTVIAATLTVGVAFAQRRPERFEPPERDRWRVEEERQRRILSERRAELEDKARQTEVWIVRTETKLVELEESGKGQSDQAQILRAELRELREGMGRIERELRGLEVEQREREVRPREIQEQQHEILRRLEELGRETDLELRRLEEQQPERSEEAVALHRRMRELNEHMRDVRQELRRQFEETDRRRPEFEEQARLEMNRHIQELVRRLEELKRNANDKKRVLRELEEQGKGETDDANVIRGKLEEINNQMQAIEKELGDIERERVRIREPRIQYKRKPAPEAMMREREELEVRARQIERELRELGGEKPERAERLERQLHEIRMRIEQIERESDRFEHPRPPVEELQVRREHLHMRMQEMEHELHELNQQGKGESEHAHNLGREMRAIQQQLETTERELKSIDREEPRRPERGDLEREVEELRMQVNSVNEQMGELRELLTRLLEERSPRER